MKKQGSKKDDGSGHGKNNSEALYRKYLRRLLRYALVLCNGCPFAAEELVHNTFLNVLRRSSAKLAAAENPEAFLIKMVKNQWIDQGRQGKREREAIVGSMDDVMKDGKKKYSPGKPPEVLRILENQYLQERLESVLEDQTEERKSVLKLHLEGYDNSEIADLTGFDKEMVKYLLNCVKATLRARLESENKKQNGTSQKH